MFFCLPSSAIREIDKLCRQFLWGDKDGKRKFYNVGWEKICRPKRLGGLGFREGILWNKIIVGRFIWAIEFKHDSLWLKWIHCIYPKNRNFWSIKASGNVSWYWKKLLGFRHLFTPAIINDSTIFGRFRSSKCYETLIGNSDLFQCFRQVWCPLALPKHRFILWLAIQGKLLTKDRLILRSLILIALVLFVASTWNLTTICSLLVTSLLHLWSKPANGWSQLGSSLVSMIGCRISMISRYPVSKMLFLLLFYKQYMVWLNRNPCIFFSFLHVC